jgi:hypothetical protein
MQGERSRVSDQLINAVIVVEVADARAGDEWQKEVSLPRENSRLEPRNDSETRVVLRGRVEKLALRPEPEDGRSPVR